MIYKNLPPVGGGASHLPRLDFVPTSAQSSRFGTPIRKVWLHRWASDPRRTTAAYHGVIRYFQNPANGASSHLVYPGSAVKDHCTQMIPFARKAWTESFFNRSGISIECADGIWLGYDPEGFAQLARITAWLLHDNGLPPVWVHAPGFLFDPRKGFCRHADGGGAAGGHTQCPTTDLALWRQFVGRVQAEHARGGFRPHWGR